MLTQEQLTMMAENVARIRENMAAAAREAGRDPADILLCAACKTRTVEEKEEPFLILLSAYWRFTSYSVNCPCYSTDFISKCSFERKRAFLSSKIDDADE